MLIEQSVFQNRSIHSDLLHTNINQMAKASPGNQKGNKKVREECPQE
jgi:hypothetical protein